MFGEDGGHGMWVARSGCRWHQIRVAGIIAILLGLPCLVGCDRGSGRKAAPAKPDPLGRVTGEKLVEPNTGMELVFIGAGSFMMGSESGADNERPVHEVSFERGFYIGATEVTQGQWEKLMGTRPWAGQSNVTEIDDCPAVYISCRDAGGFIAKLNSTVKQRGYHLPTEAEWEYACRAGTEGDYCFGDDPGGLGDYAWFQTNSGGDSGGSAHMVAAKRPNAWGLYDMHGNVWEWCGDWYDPNAYASADRAGPLGPGTGSGRVIRGGGWNATAVGCRSAARGSTTDGNTTAYLGFRVARWTYD
ncbi:MAG: formylglycine-generating enzyme family protein [Acidobacteriota bacterium]